MNVQTWRTKENHEWMNTFSCLTLLHLARRQKHSTCITYCFHTLFHCILEHKRIGSGWPGLYRFRCFDRDFGSSHQYLQFQERIHTPKSTVSEPFSKEWMSSNKYTMSNVSYGPQLINLNNTIQNPEKMSQISVYWKLFQSHHCMLRSTKEGKGSICWTYCFHNLFHWIPEHSRSGSHRQGLYKFRCFDRYPASIHQYLQFQERNLWTQINLILW